MFWPLLLLLIQVAYAHQTSMTVEGRELFWPQTDVPIYIRANTSDLDSTTVNSIVQDSIAQWNSTGAVNISSATASANEVRFSNDFEMYGSAVIGITEISYNNLGAINKAVILLNDNYTFTDVQSTFGTGSVFLGDVVTHELGHFMGLSHSEVINSSMFYTSFPGQSTIAADDRSGLLQKYSGSAGSITGKVQGGNRVGVLGVHVQAISRMTGESVGVITDEDGNFKMEGLDLDDTYYIYTSPLKHLESLPGYFSNVQKEFCPGTYTGSFFSACGREYEGFPQGITLRAGNENVDVGVITINCGLKSNQDYSYEKLQTSFSPVTIWDKSETLIKEKAFVGYFSKRTDSSWSGWDTLRIDLSGLTPALNRVLEIKFVAHAFGNLLEYEMQLVQNSIPVQTSNISNSGLLGTYSTDMSQTISLSTESSLNIFDIKIRAKRLGTSMIPLTFPSPSLFASETHLPYLLVLSLRDDTTPLFNTAAYLSDNEACLDAPFTYKVAQSNTSTESNALSSGDGDSGVAAGSCGTIDPPKSGPGGPLALMVLGFGLTVFLGLIGKKAKKFLS